jgi:thiol-disulfide isomerase/thioredoxin
VTLYRACRVAAVGHSRRTILQLVAGTCAMAMAGSSRAVALRPEGVDPFDSPSSRSGLTGLVLPDLTGQPRVLLAGERRTLLHVFATWCEPCQDELPRLAAYARETEGTELYAVAYAEPADRVSRFLARVGLELPVGIDADRRLSRTIGVDQLPTTLVLDTTLTPRWIVRGDLDWSSPAIRAWLADPH